MAQKKFYFITYDVNKEQSTSSLGLPNMTLDLSGNSSGPSGLISAIKNFEDHYKLFDRFWVVFSDRTAENIYCGLAPFIKDGVTDNVYIGEINTYNEQGWLPKKFWSWIDEMKKKNKEG